MRVLELRGIGCWSVEAVGVGISTVERSAKN